MKHLDKITIIGLGLLGGSISLASKQALPTARIVGYSHRRSTRRRALELAVAHEVADTLVASVADADLVILATPIMTFQGIFREVAGALKQGCIVTDVGSTKLLPHRWAAEELPPSVHYVGSHPVAGSERRGVEFSRDDLFDRALCILTMTEGTDHRALQTLKRYWSALGCRVTVMDPAEHDRVFANVSHVPHVMAAALVNATDAEQLKFAGKGFLDTSRIASGPANIWTDVLLTNGPNVVEGLDRMIIKLARLRNAIEAGDAAQIQGLLDAAGKKRTDLVRYKMRRKELST